MQPGNAFYGIMIIGGPIVLALAILWAFFHNRMSRRDAAKRDQGTHDLYKADAPDSDAP